MKKPHRRIKRKVLVTGFMILLVLFLGAGYFLHLIPSASTMSHVFEPKIAAGALTPIGDSASSLSLPLARPLIVDFTSSEQDLYTPLTIQFLDMSRGQPASWHWEFGDNTSSSLQDPVHEYATPGIWNVTLAVTRNDGAMGTMTVNDVLSAGNAPGKAILLDTYRQGVLMKGSWIALVVGTDDAFASFNNARTKIPNGSVVKLRTNVDGEGMITMRYGNILRFESPDATLFVNGTQVASGPSGDCYLTGYHYPHANLTFSIVPTMGEMRQFLVDNEQVRVGTENSHIVITRDSTDLRKDLTLISTPAYFEGQASSLFLSSALAADFVYGPPAEGNAPLNVSFRDRSAGAPESWQWDFGDGTHSTEKNPLHRYTGAGSYTVSLTVTKGVQTDSKAVENAITTSPPKLLADFNATPAKGTAPLRVQFNDNSTGSPSSWAWGIGGTGSFSTGSGTHVTSDESAIPDLSVQNPVITFLDPGVYSVWMTAGNLYGSNYAIKTGYITVTDPYRIPTQDIFAKTGKRGYIRKDSSIRFVVGDTPATIGMNGGFRELPKGATISIVAGSDQSGDIFIDSGKLLKFSFPDMALFVNGDFVQAGRIDSIYVPYLTKFDTALTYYLPPESARTQFTIDGFSILDDLDNAWIRIDSLGMSKKGSLSLVSTGNSTYIDGAANQTVHDWIIR